MIVPIPLWLMQCTYKEHNIVCIRLDTLWNHELEASCMPHIWFDQIMSTYSYLLPVRIEMCEAEARMPRITQYVAAGICAMANDNGGVSSEMY